METVSNVLSRDQVQAMMSTILVKHGKQPVSSESDDLAEIGFRSLDFSDLALQVEQKIGRQLNFDAPGLRDIVTAGDAIDFLLKL